MTITQLQSLLRYKDTAFVMGNYFLIESPQRDGRIRIYPKEGYYRIETEGGSYLSDDLVKWFENWYNFDNKVKLSIKETTMTKQLFTLSDEQKQSLINDLISEWESMKLSFTREELECDGNSGIDVRLQVVDDEVNLHIGDSQYDTNHKGCWGYAFIDLNCDRDELEDIVTDLVKQVEEARHTPC